MNLPPQISEALLSIARHSIEYFLETKQILPYENIKLASDIRDALRDPHAAFVILYTKTHKHHMMRGVNGIFESFEPLGKLIGQLAVNAAFFDPHAPRLKPYELNILSIHIVLPGVRCKIIGDTQQVIEIIEKDRQGVIAETDGRIAYALPYEWAPSMNGQQMIRNLNLQLGITRKSKKRVEYETFSATEIND